MSQFFQGVEQTPEALSEGTCDLPILYREASQLGVFFRFDLARARELLAGATVEPWPMLGSAVGAIYVWEYRDTTVGAYRELGLGIQCRRRGTSPSIVRLGLDMAADEDQGIWVQHLPVTTQAAYLAGVELWGYPKYVTEIETRFEDQGASVRLGGEFTLTLGRIRGVSKALPIATFTARQGRLIRTSIRTEHPVTFGLAAGARLTLTGDGPTAESIRRLGIDRATPLAAFRTDRWHAILPAGRDLGPAGVPGPSAG
jgi:hypothetical protein